MVKSTAKIVSMFLMVMFCFSNLVLAQDEMPPMGAPDEMKSVAWLEGTWDVDQKFLMSDTADIWESSQGVAVYSMALDGCVLSMDYTAELMGMPFAGTFLQNYDRVTGKWQSVWIDNMAARISFYEGSMTGDTLVMEGVDYGPDGKPYLARLTTVKLSEESFDWQFEMSQDDGKTYLVVGEAKYTKQK